MIEARRAAASFARTIAARRGRGRARSIERAELLQPDPRRSEECRSRLAARDERCIVSIDGGKTFTRIRVARTRASRTITRCGSTRTIPSTSCSATTAACTSRTMARGTGTTSTTCRSASSTTSRSTTATRTGSTAACRTTGTFAFPSGTHSRGALTNAEVTFLGYGDGFQVGVDPTRSALRLHEFAERTRLRGRPRHARGAPHHAGRRRHAPSRIASTGTPPILVSPNDPHDLLLRRAQAARRRPTAAQTWQEISPDLTTQPVDWEGSVSATGIPAARQHSLSRDDGIGAYGNITTISESPKRRGHDLRGHGRRQRADDDRRRRALDESHGALPSARAAVGEHSLASRFDARTAYVAFDGH